MLQCSACGVLSGVMLCGARARARARARACGCGCARGCSVFLLLCGIILSLVAPCIVAYVYVPHPYLYER